MNTPYYAGKTIANPDYADGGLAPVLGARNFQALRARRAVFPFNTYNHAPMLTYWKNQFYLSYLSNPVSEHLGAGQTFLLTSADGESWSQPRVLFPVLTLPAGGRLCSDGEKVVLDQDTPACMHQRMGFYESKTGRLLASGFYGHSDAPWVCPWENNGVGRVVREIYEDGSMGPIYFIRLLTYAGWKEADFDWPTYQKSPDAGFVSACEELLSDSLVTQQWIEEHGLRDECVRFKDPEKREAFCWYHISDHTVAGLWKQGWSGLSRDGGLTWAMKKQPSFATAGAKAWGQRTGDEGFALSYVCNIDTERRYPLVCVVSRDGVKFDGMACVYGETPPRRYQGIFKDIGPQYVRGICEGHAQYPEGAMWLCHSVSKEDIWVAKLPYPLRREETEPVCDDFSCDNGRWNLYSPVFAPARIENGALTLSDCEKHDYAKATRLFKKSSRGHVSLSLMADAPYDEALEIELCDERGLPVCRALLDKSGLRARSAGQIASLSPYADGWTKLEIDFDCRESSYSLRVNDGEPASCLFMRAARALSRLVLRTKPFRPAPGVEAPVDTPDVDDRELPPDAMRVYRVKRVEITG